MPIDLNARGLALMEEIIAEELCFSDDAKHEMLLEIARQISVEAENVVRKVEVKIIRRLESLFEKTRITKFRRELIPLVCMRAPGSNSFEEIDLDIGTLGNFGRSEYERHAKECRYCKDFLSRTY